MKKFLFIIAVAAVALVSCKKDDTSVKSVSLDQTSITLNIGESATLVASVEPATALDKSVTWASDNEAVATVKDGVVSAVALGNANITVTTKDGAKTASCAVTVKEITWKAVFTENFDTNPIRKVANPDGKWAMFVTGDLAAEVFGWVDPAGASKWTTNDASLYASSYWGPAYAVDAWLVSPAIDLSSAKYAKVNFKESQKYHPTNDTITMWATIDEGIQDLGDASIIWWGGPINEAPKGTWVQLAIPNHATMTADTYDFSDSGDVDLSDFAGETVRIAFRYVATAEAAGTWNIDDIVVSAGE